MGIIDKYKEQRAKDKEEFFEKLEEAKEYTKESFSKEHMNERFEANKARLQSSEMKEISSTQYTTHMKLMMIGIVFLVIGFIFPPIFIIALGCFAGGLVCMAVNWKRINSEHKNRKQIK
ncbi:hypothetical protein [Clostridium beijerinckii]|uniref:Membrane protein n=1 Tax=Clostridium beijerinckii TaxID=1520 RepID=A0AAE5LSR9_CLOBE|nr:hypothetical protein [Clostridium beijerinckii]NSB17451.1 putative membrane protein [Clostridium beijerinckii]OOM28438.1 hypothetical protein CLOBE_26940 [Clostridium beijerinckii]